MNKRIIYLLIGLISLSAFSQNESKRLANFNLENKIAIQGYDPVSYFKGKPLKGKKEISTTFEGVVYNFSSVANRDTFLKKPMSYEPQFGGWCAYAMGSSGDKVEIDPETFKILDGKLYLFYNAYFNNTLKSWNKDEVNLKKKADANWKKFTN
jgi:YHS domain-containing protein